MFTHVGSLSVYAFPPQDEPHREPLQVEYYPPNGTFSLHYFPYYGKKAQVCGAPPPLGNAKARRG